MTTPNSSTSYGDDDSKSHDYTEFKLSTWILWILAHVISLPLSIMIGFVAIHLFSFIGKLLPEIVSSGLGYILWGAIVGGIIGFIQWLFLKWKYSILYWHKIGPPHSAGPLAAIHKTIP